VNGKGERLPENAGGRSASRKMQTPVQHRLEGLQLPLDLHFAHAARTAVAAVDSLNNRFTRAYVARWYVSVRRAC
jgi:hypothetical protein